MNTNVKIFLEKKLMKNINKSCKMKKGKNVRERMKKRKTFVKT